MVHTRAQTAARRALPSPASNYQGNQPQGNRLCPTTHSETPTPQEQPASVQSRGRKRKHPTGHALEGDLDPDAERQRTSPPRPTEDAFGEPAIGSGAHKHTDPVASWVKEGRWPEEQDWPEETSETNFTMERLLARKKSSSNLSRKRSNSATSTTPSDQKPREEKSAPYRDARYTVLLETKGSYMDISELGITDTSKQLIRDLLNGKQSVPQGTLFDDSIFVNACRNLKDKNEARIIQDVSRLIVPSAESLALWNKTINALSKASTKGGTTRSLSPAPVHSLTTPLGSDEKHSLRTSSPSCRHS